MNKSIHIIGGGTMAHIRPHLSLAAPAYGKVVRDLFDAIYDSNYDGLVHCYTTKMAGNRHTIWTARSGTEDVEPKNLETNADVADLLNELCIDPAPKIIFLPAALCDFDIDAIDGLDASTRFEIGKAYPRLSSERPPQLSLKTAEKVIGTIRKFRKDIFLVGFKTTTDASPAAQFEAGLTLVKKASCNLVLANDLVTRTNMIITPEQAPYHVTTDRRSALRKLVEMTLSRAQGHFTRSTILPTSKPVTWTSNVVPASLRTVVDHCIKRGAYKPFLGSTVGHFAFKLDDNTFVTSKRKVDFNKLDEVGMVMVESRDANTVVAYGAKPSVGGQSQRIIFANHPDVDCIVHFHCPMKGNRHENLVRGDIPMRSQAEHECGSHECGQNTSDGLKIFELYNGKLKYPVKAVMLEQHGPNIVFHRDTDPQLVIDFIEKHWDLERSTSEITS